MTEFDVVAFVKASAAAQGVPMDEARAQRVAVHMARTAQLADLLASAPLAVEDELAEIYKPKPFPAIE